MTSITKNSKGLAIATVIAIFATLSINTLSNFFPPGGKNVGEIANTILGGVLITPENYAFAIWGIIYLGLIAYGFYQLRAFDGENQQIKQVNQLLITACIAQIIWICLFTLQQFWWSIVAMLAILLPLVKIYLILNIGKEKVTTKRRWFIQIPFSIYLSWIAVATIVNIASALYASGWQGWGINEINWTIIMLVIAGIIASMVILLRRDIAFTLVFVWAYVAIAVRHATLQPIWLTAAIIAILLLCLLGLKLWQNSTQT